MVVLTGLDTKGLEFDGIVVVRPQEIEDESATGRATLYVVLTRATQLADHPPLTAEVGVNASAGTAESA